MVALVESVSRRRLLRGVGAASLAGLASCSTASAERPSLISATPVTEAPPIFGQELRSPGQAVTGEQASRQVGDEDGTDDSGLDDGVLDESGTDPASSPDEHRSIIATALASQVQVFAEPDDGSEVTHVMDNPTATNGPLVFLTTINAGLWHQVLLPVRPNGSTGWVRGADVQLAEHRYRIQVDLEDFRMRVFEQGRTIFDAVAGVASNNTPTPGGIYYLTELLAPTVPNSAYGAFAYGLSGFSEVFETFNGGPGQLGIHGTNDPDTLGTAVSAGCIRLHNDDISRLATYLPLGVPVTVRA